MKKYEKVLKSNLVKYIMIWLVYLVFVFLYIVSGIENTLLAILAFPLNIVLGYLIAQAVEFKRAAEYIKQYHPSHWDDIKGHVIGSTIRPGWYNSSKDNLGDKNIIIIKRNLRDLGILKVITIIHIVVISLVVYYFG